MPVPFILLNLLLIVSFAAGGILLARRKKTARVGLALAVLVALAGAGMATRPDLAVTLVPSPNLIFFSNLYPFAAALFIPCVFPFARTRGQRIRIGLLCALLFALTLKGYEYHFQPLAVSYNQVVDDNGVCRQSSADTCSDAALVTLFHQYGIETTEAEMIRLARTRRDHGTTLLGEFRALALKRQGRPDLTPRLRKWTVERLLEWNKPAIITVGLPRQPTAATRNFGRKYNWQSGVFHDVTFLGIDPARPDHVLIADPDFGLEFWPVGSLRLLYRGFTAYLEKKAPRDGS